MRFVRSATRWTKSCSRGCATPTSALLARARFSCRAQGVKAVMPGVAELLDALARATRRVPRAAHRQLRAKARASSSSISTCGATSGAARSATMPPIAMRSCRSRSSGRAACGLEAIAPEDVFVVGDTPHDVACARAVGAVPVGVATGIVQRRADLRASGAEIVFRGSRATRRAFMRVIDRAESITNRARKSNGARWPSRSSKPVAARVIAGGLGSTPRRFRPAVRVTRQHWSKPETSGRRA